MTNPRTTRTTSAQTPAQTPAQTSAQTSAQAAPAEARAAGTRAAETSPAAPSARALAALEAARRRTALLTDSVDEQDLTAQHSPLMSPLVWDLAHIGNQEELWLVREAGGRTGLRPDLDHLYDAFQHPRADRPALPLLGPAQARAYSAGVREQALEVLAGTDTDPERPERLLAGAFVFGMLAQHEQQHDETMLATHQLRAGAPVLDAPEPPPAPADAARLPREVLVPGGPFTMGTSTEPWALDNELPAHTVDVPGFWLDTVPVTNGAYAGFIAAGGYDDPRWWTPEGWRHVREAGLVAPLFWERDGDGWARTRFGRTERVPDDEPVLHVCWYEADAYARWAGRRLPTEAEWEKAARHDPATGRSRRYPWGDAEPGPEHANLGQRHLRPAPAGSYPSGAAPSGARQLVGDVWEWTSSDFAPYPGFAVFPYKEYSDVFFGPDYKVLRGGAFGVGEVASRATFRNWDYPIRRQIFAGFRTARDAAASDDAGAGGRAAGVPVADTAGGRATEGRGTGAPPAGAPIPDSPRAGAPVTDGPHASTPIPDGPRTGDPVTDGPRRDTPPPAVPATGGRA